MATTPEQRAAYGAALEQALMKAGENQSTLAAKLHVRRQTINGYVQGVRTPDPAMSQRIEVILQAQLGYHLGYGSVFAPRRADMTAELRDAQDRLSVEVFSLTLDEARQAARAVAWIKARSAARSVLGDDYAQAVALAAFVDDESVPDDYVNEAAAAAFRRASNDAANVRSLHPVPASPNPDEIREVDVPDMRPHLRAADAEVATDPGLRPKGKVRPGSVPDAPEST